MKWKEHTRIHRVLKRLSFVFRSVHFTNSEHRIWRRKKNRNSLIGKHKQQLANSCYQIWSHVAFLVTTTLVTTVHHFVLTSSWKLELAYLHLNSNIVILGKFQNACWALFTNSVELLASFVVSFNFPLTQSARCCQLKKYYSELAPKCQSMEFSVSENSRNSRNQIRISWLFIKFIKKY